MADKSTKDDIRRWIHEYYAHTVRIKHEEMQEESLKDDAYLAAEAVKRARQGDRKEAVYLLLEFCDTVKSGFDVNPLIQAFIAECIEEGLNTGEMTAAFYLAHGKKGRPAGEWTEKLEWAIKVQRRRNFGQSRTQAIKAVSSEIHKEPRTVELAYDEYREVAKRIAEKPQSENK